MKTPDEEAIGEYSSPEVAMLIAQRTLLLNMIYVWGRRLEGHLLGEEMILFADKAREEWGKTDDSKNRGKADDTRNR